MDRTNNRVYIASKLGTMEPVVTALKSSLEEQGYVINYDWTEHPVAKPFAEHARHAHEAAENMARAVMECDVLVVLCAPNGVGYHIETGGALVTGIILQFIQGQGAKRIYVVGEGNDRSVFYYHASVTRLPDIESLLRELS